MPAFTFEKISPPARSGALPTAEKKPRSVIVQILDRLVEGSEGKSTASEPPAVVPRQPK